MAATVKLATHEHGHRAHRVVDAVIYGPFAAHRSVDTRYPNSWTLTHAASGRAILQTATRREALVLATELDTLPVDWARGQKMLMSERRLACNLILGWRAAGRCL